MPAGPPVSQADQGTRPGSLPHRYDEAVIHRYSVSDLRPHVFLDLGPLLRMWEPHSVKTLRCSVSFSRRNCGPIGTVHTLVPSGCCHCPPHVGSWWVRQASVTTSEPPKRNGNGCRWASSVILYISTIILLPTNSSLPLPFSSCFSNHLSSGHLVCRVLLLLYLRFCKASATNTTTTTSRLGLVDIRHSSRRVYQHCTTRDNNIDCLDH